MHFETEAWSDMWVRLLWSKYKNKYYLIIYQLDWFHVLYPCGNPFAILIEAQWFCGNSRGRGTRVPVCFIWPISSYNTLRGTLLKHEISFTFVWSIKTELCDLFLIKKQLKLLLVICFRSIYNLDLLLSL